ncbi:peptidase S8/S53 domain-containing protein [Zopfochytrium polystomum]|nr:peptidase S8/S53 domain-containing protein [Zopfochytrium polystomum]
MVSLAILATAAAGLAAAAAVTVDALSHAENTGTFLHMAMVEFPTGNGCSFQADNIVNHLKERGYRPTIRTVTNTNLFCGVSFSLANTRRNATHSVKDLDGTLSVSPVQNRQKATIAGSSESTAHPEAIHTLTGVDKARSELGLTGKGITVAVIDTGAYYKHPALGGCFGPGCKIVKGYDFVGNNYTGSSDTIVPDSDPLDDCSDESHGTHVIGIVAGDARNITQPGFVPLFPWSGVAPDASIAAYRVFGCNGSTGSDVVAAAIYRAADEGADIINMSLGFGPSFSDDIDAVAVDRVSKNGVLVFVSAGNDGDAGLFAVSSPAVAQNGFGVAAVENVETVQFQLKVGDQVFPWSPGLNGSFASRQTLDIFINNPNAVAQNVHDDGCTTVNAGAAGKAVLLRWGSGCKSFARCTVAQQAGATACIIYSDDDTLISVAGGDIPTASTSREAGGAILTNPNVPVIITKDDMVFPNTPVGTVSTFSSGGLDPELHMKPDFGAIGGRVYSSISPHAAEVQGFNGPYATYDGTSMASPYAAGIAALLLQKRGKMSFDDVKTVLQNNAVPMKQFKTENVDTVALQGAGLLNIYNAATAKTIVTPSFLALNDSQYGRKDHFVTIKNNYGKPVSYTVKHVGALTANPFDGVSDFVQLKTVFTSNYASLGFGNKQEAVLTTVVAANASYQVNVKVTPPASADPSRFPLYSGYIAITNNVDTSTVHVPYVGMVGNWMDSPIYAVRYPDGVDRGAGFYTTNGSAIVAGSTVNVTEGNIMLFSSFAGSTRNGIAEVVYTGTDAAVKDALKKIGLKHSKSQGIPVIRVENNGTLAGAYFGQAPRNSAMDAQSIHPPVAYYWGGDVIPDTTAEDAVLLPPGEYKLRLKGLKHFKPPGYEGDQHFQIIETASFHLVY